MNCERCGRPHSQKDWDELFTDWQTFFLTKKGQQGRRAWELAHREMKKHGPRPAGPKKPSVFMRIGIWLAGGKEKLMLKALSSFLPGLVKGMAEGQYGPVPEKLYWALAGKKTWISVGIGALWAFGWYVVIPALQACGVDCGAATNVPQITAWLDVVKDVVPWLIAAGIADAGLRLEPPQKPKE
jgi:hypothetical protein